MVAEYLGLRSYTIVLGWIRRGILKARRRESGDKGYWVIEDADILLFLRTHGAMCEAIHPKDPVWRRHVAESRALFLLDHIVRSDIAAMIHVEPKHISWLIRHRAFPMPAYYFHTHKGGGDFFVKRAIIEWLRVHSTYDPSGLVRR